MLQATDLLKAGKREHPLALWPSTSLTNGVYRPSTFPCDGQHLEQLQLLKDLQLDGQDLCLRICSLPRAHHYTRRSSGLKSRQDTTPDSSQNLQIPKTTHASTQYLQDGTQVKTGLRIQDTTQTTATDKFIENARWLGGRGPGCSGYRALRLRPQTSIKPSLLGRTEWPWPRSAAQTRTTSVGSTRASQ